MTTLTKSSLLVEAHWLQWWSAIDWSRLPYRVTFCFERPPFEAPAYEKKGE